MACWLEILPVALTLPFVVPLTGGGWRWALVTWGGVVVVIAVVVALLAPQVKRPEMATFRLRGWPNWRSSLIWRLGLVFGSVNSIYFATNSFLPIYLASAGRNGAISGALTALNIGQLPASLVLLAMADRLAGRAWRERFLVSAALCSRPGAEQSRRPGLWGSPVGQR